MSPVVGKKMALKPWNTVSGIQICFAKNRVFRSHGGNNQGL